MPADNRIYSPEPGSLTHRVLAWFGTHADEELSYRDIAHKFDVANANHVRGCLAIALNAGILQTAQDADGRTIVRTGPRFVQWRADHADAEVARAERRALAGQRRRSAPAPLLDDLDAIPLRVGVSHPKFGHNAMHDGRTLLGQMTELIGRLRPGVSIVLPDAYRSTASEAVTRWRRAHPTHNVSIVSEPDGAFSINRYADNAGKKGAAA